MYSFFSKNKSGSKFPGYLILFTGLVFSTVVYAQPDSNLKIFYGLVDSACYQIVDQLPGGADTINLNLNLGSEYTVFENRILSAFQSSGLIIRRLNRDSSDNLTMINFIIDNCEVTYKDIYRDGWFGDYFVSRSVNLSGSYAIINEQNVIKSFNYSYIDSIKVDEIKLLENQSYPFTKGDIPAEPFLPGIIEPVIAIGAAAVAVVLFFTIRSK